ERAVAVHDRIPLRLREVGERIAGNLDRPDRAGDELQLIRSTWRYQVLLSSLPIRNTHDARLARHAPRPPGDARVLRGIGRSRRLLCLQQLRYSPAAQRDERA